MNMKRNILVLLAAVVAAALLAGCSFLFPTVVGSGYRTTSSYGFGGYGSIAASQAFKVHVIPDAIFSLQVTCDDNVVPYLVVRQSGSRMELGLQQGYNYMGVTVSAEVHMPALAALDLSGAAQAQVEPGFSSSFPFTLTVSGASLATIKGLVCGPVSADISGASTLTFVGTAAAESLYVSGASTADLRNCTGTGAEVNASGASAVYVNVGSGHLGYSVSGASTLYYRGAPTLQQRDLSGASRIVPIL
jgi:hypothetical protein